MAALRHATERPLRAQLAISPQGDYDFSRDMGLHWVSAVHV